MSTPANEPNRPADPNQPQDPNQPPTQPQYGQQMPQYGQNQPQYGQQAPQYGQQMPQYGQQAPQHGQGQPQYGQGAYGQPSPYAYPASQTGPAAPRVAPKEVIWGFWLILAAGALYLLTAIVGAIDPGAQIPPGQLDQLLAASGGGIDRESFLSMLGTWILVTGVIFTGLYVLIAFMVKKGKNWARITGTVLAGLSLLNIAGGLLPALCVLVGVAGIVMLWLKPSNDYFRPRPLGY